ncbi:MAG: hypothetical protein PHY05_11885 [Methanothrix sp.]|nr:hypothetical protein [Methanothrix sp.]
MPGNPARPDDDLRTSGRPGPHAAATSSSRDLSGTKARPCGCPGLLSVARKDRKAETASTLFVRPLCLRAFVVWSVVAGYNY